jgi:hypothetical protein
MTPVTGVLPGEGPLFVFDSTYLAQAVSRGKKIGSRMRQMQDFPPWQGSPESFFPGFLVQRFLKNFSAIFKLEREPKIHLEIWRGC